MAVQTRHNGKHLVRWTDHLGRSRGATFEANEKRKAQDFDAEMKRRRRMGEIVAPSDMSLSELRQHWLTIKGDEFAAKTREINDAIWVKHIKPRFGSAPIGRVTVLDVDEFIVRLKKDGVGQATIVKALAQLSAIFTVAVKRQLVPMNPVSLADKPRSKKGAKVVRALSPLQVEQIRAWMTANASKGTLSSSRYSPTVAFVPAKLSTFAGKTLTATLFTSEAPFRTARRRRPRPATSGSSGSSLRSSRTCWSTSSGSVVLTIES